MEILEPITYFVFGCAALYVFVRVCVWAYWLGYGNTPRKVTEPIEVLSTGERRPIERTPQTWQANATIHPNYMAYSNCAYSPVRRSDQ